MERSEPNVRDARVQTGVVAAGTRAVVPAIFAGEARAARRYLEFFTVNIRNANTRQAYLRAARAFAGWCADRAVALEDVEPMVVAAYVEELGQRYARATVKQHLAGIRMLFDWLVIGHALEANPAASVRGPKHVVTKGKTPVLSADEARRLLDAIDTSTVVGLRDRALVAVMTFGFARVSATVAMRVRDYYSQGKRSYVRLHEKGGRFNEVPAHHLVQEYMDAYIEVAGIAEDRDGPLFRAAERGRKRPALSERALTRQRAWEMVKRRAAGAGLPYEITPHSFRGTGITEYLRGGGDRDVAAKIAGHESTRTTRLYDRRDDEVSLDEIERIHI